MGGSPHLGVSEIGPQQNSLALSLSLSLGLCVFSFVLPTALLGEPSQLTTTAQRQLWSEFLYDVEHTSVSSTGYGQAWMEGMRRKSGEDGKWCFGF